MMIPPCSCQLPLVAQDPTGPDEWHGMAGGESPKSLPNMYVLRCFGRKGNDGNGMLVQLVIVRLINTRLYQSKAQAFGNNQCCLNIWAYKEWHIERLHHQDGTHLGVKLPDHSSTTLGIQIHGPTQSIVGPVAFIAGFDI
jgi:hypothetical protein